MLQTLTDSTHIIVTAAAIIMAKRYFVRVPRVRRRAILRETPPAHASDRARSVPWLPREFVLPAAFALLVGGLILTTFTMSGGWEKDWSRRYFDVVPVPGWFVFTFGALVEGVYAVGFFYMGATLAGWTLFRLKQPIRYLNSDTRYRPALRLSGRVGVLALALYFLYQSRESGHEGAHEGLLTRGRAAVVGNSPDEAIALLTEAIGLSPDDAFAYFQRARAWTLKGDRPAALADYDTVIALDGDGGAHHNRGLLRKETGDLAGATADFTQAIATAGIPFFSYYQRGECHRVGKDYRAAINDYTSAIKLDPAGAVAYWGRALAYNQIDEDERAAEDRAAFRRLVKIPDEPR